MRILIGFDPLTGVQWLWELHNQKVGGIIGDEMVSAQSTNLCP